MQKVVKIFLIFLLLINIIYVVSGIFTFPLNNVDVYGIWFLKAKAVYLLGGFPFNFLKDINYLYSHPRYPLLFPFFVSLFYFLSGGIKEIFPLLASPLVYAFIIILVYKTARILEYSQNKALIISYVYSMLSPLLAEGGRKLAGNADIYLVFIYWIIIYIVLAKKLVNPKWTLFIVFLVMISSQIKMEGAFISVILLFLPIERKKKIIYFCISLIPAIVWIFLVNWLAIPTDIYYAPLSFGEILRRIFLTFIGIAKEMANYRNWYIFWLLFFALIFIVKSRINFINKTIVPTVILMSTFYFAVYVLSNLDAYGYVSSSADRVMLQISPLIFVIFIERVRDLLTLK